LGLVSGLGGKWRQDWSKDPAPDGFFEAEAGAATVGLLLMALG
jgi:hypothetical protein